MMTKEKLKKKLRLLSAKEHRANVLLSKAFKILKEATKFSQ